MDFEITDEQMMLRQMVREFAEKEIKPKVEEYEKKHEFPAEFVQKLADIGVMGMGVPHEFGGTHSDHLSIYLMIEEMSRIMPSLAVVLSVHCSLFCYCVLKFGTQNQKEKYLPRAAEGEIIGAFSLTEPGAGSDIASVQTTAVKKGGTYVLNGTKSWVTSGSIAGAYILFARTDSGDNAKKISAFIVDRDSPGLAISKIEQKMGLGASPTSEIVLEDCEVPAENLLGSEGQGGSIALHGLDGSRIGIAAQSVGIGQRALDDALAYAKHRKAFSHTLAKFQAIKFFLADMATQLDAARLLTYRAADLFDRGKPFTKEAAMAKLYASEAANKIVYNALQIHGAYGYSQEFFIEQLYRDARVLPIYEGTSEIQRIVISRELLK